LDEWSTRGLLVGRIQSRCDDGSSNGHTQLDAESHSELVTPNGVRSRAQEDNIRVWAKVEPTRVIRRLIRPEHDHRARGQKQGVPFRLIGGQLQMESETRSHRSQLAWSLARRE
jgi:hypothetical protein